MTRPYSHINLLQGTNSVPEYSTGNTLPLVARPWGMHHWSLQTNDRPWFFRRESRKLWGIRLTHQPSPWMREYGSLMLQPFHGDYNPDPNAQASGYRPEDTVLEPAYMQVTQLRYGITIELSPSERGALLRFTRSGQQALRIRLDFPEAHRLSVEPGNPHMHGWTADAHEGEDLVDFSMKFVGEFSVAPERFERTEAASLRSMTRQC
ncbi:MAG: hypothetical protein PF795_10320, partial [Kiritimatiellae bacterium]|nr:hypothetical protein [Kiritimatiellia bacterium]